MCCVVLCNVTGPHWNTLRWRTWVFWKKLILFKDWKNNYSTVTEFLLEWLQQLVATTGNLFNYQAVFMAKSNLGISIRIWWIYFSNYIFLKQKCLVIFWNPLIFNFLWYQKVWFLLFFSDLGSMLVYSTHYRHLEKPQL